MDVFLPVSQRECQDLAEFVREVLGPYSSNVTAAARLCSASLCQGKGRCVRQNAQSRAYLHLPPPAELMEKVTEKVSVKMHRWRIHEGLAMLCILAIIYPIKERELDGRSHK